MCVMVVGSLIAAGIVGRWLAGRWKEETQKDTSHVDASSAVDDYDPEAGNDSSTIESADCDAECGRGDLVSAGDNIESRSVIRPRSSFSVHLSLIHI